MELKKISKVLIAVTFSSCVVFSSCKKDETNIVSTDPATIAAATDATESIATTEAQFDDVFNITMGVQSSDAGEDIGIETGVDVIYQTNVDSDGAILIQTPASPRCFTVSVIPRAIHEFPKTITIDFGSGCTGKDGKVRKGKIISIYTGPMFIPGSKCSTSFEDYFVDSFKIEGQNTIENTSATNEKEWKVTVTDGKITNMHSGAWEMWNSTKTHRQVEGNGTPRYPLDDIFHITGSTVATASNGNRWEALIVDPLVKKIGCHWITKGNIEISKNNIKAKLDYGDGTCDNEATITINGVSYNITLHK
ncbi:MAG: hypothetical protein ABIO77_08725 [Ginsengibacter sp.]